MPLCAVCRRNNVTQDHHIIYEPYEVKIGVCKPCHTDIHGHGTGPPKMPEADKVKGVRGIPDEIWKMVRIRTTLTGETIGAFVTKALAARLSDPS